MLQPHQNEVLQASVACLGGVITQPCMLQQFVDSSVLMHFPTISGILMSFY